MPFLLPDTTKSSIQESEPSRVRRHRTAFPPYFSLITKTEGLCSGPSTSSRSRISPLTRRRRPVRSVDPAFDLIGHLMALDIRSRYDRRSGEDTPWRQNLNGS